MDFHTIITCVVVMALIFFCIDFLSDSQIQHSETKIGILQLTHHLLPNFIKIGGLLALAFGNQKSLMPIAAMMIFFTLIMQIGYLINNDYCWYTRMVNKMINKDHPKRKWRSNTYSLVKHYIRGDDWAYSDIYNADNTVEVIMVNVLVLLIIIKYVYKKNKGTN
jgi:hypothetical protein